MIYTKTKAAVTTKERMDSMEGCLGASNIIFYSSLGRAAALLSAFITVKTKSQEMDTWTMSNIPALPQHSTHMVL